MDALADAGFRVANLFEKVKTSESSHPPDDLIPKLAAEADRFQLWAINLGLLVSGHASLDYRVRDAEAIRFALLRLIASLEDALSEVLDYLGNPSDLSQTSEQVGEEDVDDEGFGLQDGSDSDILWEGIRDPIDRLFKLALWIRNPSSRSASQKVLQYRVIDPESGVDLLDVFRKCDYDYVSSLFLEFRKSRARANHPEAEPAPEEGNSDQSLDYVDCVWEPIRTLLSQHKEECVNGAESFLVRRIAQANARRRQQFAYWRNHRSKLGQHSARAIQQTTIQHDVAIAQAEPGDQRLLDSTFAPAVGAAPSVTTASRLDVLRVASWNDQATVGSVTEYAASAWQPGKEQLGFPPPPTHLSDGKFFECPYCFTICSSRLLSDGAWRAHLIHDLRPYLCTYNDCRMSDYLYDSIETWIKHEETAHRPSLRCPEHLFEVFSSKEDFRSHIESEHVSWSNDVKAALVNFASESSSNVTTRCCPICLAAYATTRELNIHIARHLERFSLFSLPRSAGDCAAIGSDQAASSKPNQSGGDSRQEGMAETLRFTPTDAGRSEPYGVQSGRSTPESELETPEPELETPPRTPPPPSQPSPQATSPAAAINELRPDEMEALSKLKEGELHERAAAAILLGDVIVSRHILGDTILDIWRAAKDLIEPSKPDDARYAAWQLFSKCARHISSSDVGRQRELFEDLMAPASQDDFFLRLAALEALTMDGGHVDEFSHSLFPLLATWLGDCYLVVREARRRGSRGGVKKGPLKGQADAMNEERNLSHLFTFIKNVITLNPQMAWMASADGGLIDILIKICLSTSANGDLAACISIINTLVDSIHNDKLKSCIQVLSSTYRMVPTLTKDAWQCIDKFLRSSHGQSAVMILLDVLRTHPGPEGSSAHKDSIRNIRAALYVFRRLLMESADPKYPAIPFALLIDALASLAPEASDTRISLEILKLINSLFYSPNGNINAIVVGESWSAIFSVAVKCAETALGTPAPASSDAKNEKDNVAHQVMRLVGVVEKLLAAESEGFKQGDDCRKFLDEVRPSARAARDAVERLQHPTEQALGKSVYP